MLKARNVVLFLRNSSNHTQYTTVLSSKSLWRKLITSFSFLLTFLLPDPITTSLSTRECAVALGYWSAITFAGWKYLFATEDYASTPRCFFGIVQSMAKCIFLNDRYYRITTSENVEDTNSEIWLWYTSFVCMFTLYLFIGWNDKCLLLHGKAQTRGVLNSVDYTEFSMPDASSEK